MGNRTKRKPAPCEWECGHLLSSCKQGKQQKVGADHKAAPPVFHGSVSAPAHSSETAKCWFRRARVLCRVPLSKCSFAEHIFTPRNASVKSTEGAKPEHAAGRTKSLTPVLHHLMRILGEGKKPTVFPGQAGWWQCTEVVQDEAWFLDTGNSSPSCAMRISPLLGRVTEVPASGC